MSLLKRRCTIHEDCDLEAMAAFLHISGIPAKEVHLGGNVYGLQADLRDEYGLVTRNGETGYEAGWYLPSSKADWRHKDRPVIFESDLGDICAEVQDGLTLSEVVKFLRVRFSPPPPSFFSDLLDGG